jgi:hypothetical protein
VQTERTILNCKLDVIIHDHEKGTYMLIDATISGDRNVIKKEAEKILKYKYVTIEVQGIWNVKMIVIPVIKGATGTISESFRKYWESMKSRNYRKQSYSTLFTDFGKYAVKVQNIQRRK